MKRITTIVFFVLALIQVSCNKDKEMIEYTLKIDFPDKVSRDNFSDSAPDFLRPLLNYREIKSCENKIFVPKIVVRRLDVGVKEKIPAPLSVQAKLQKKMMRKLSAANLKDGYDVNRIKFPDLIFKDVSEFEKEKIHPIKESSKNMIVLSPEEDKKSLDEKLQDIDMMLCKKGVRTIVIRIEESTHAEEQPADDDTAIEGDPEVTGYSEPEEEQNGTDKGNRKPEKEKGKVKVINAASSTASVMVGGIKFRGNGGKFYSSYASYFGGIKNGKAHGQGTMVFKKTHAVPVPSYSAKKYTAQKGYRLSGRFREGYFVSGVLYDANGQKVKTILVGR